MSTDLDKIPASVRAAILELPLLPKGFSSPAMVELLIGFHRKRPAVDLVRELHAWVDDHNGDPPRDPAAAFRGYLNSGKALDRPGAYRRCIEKDCLEIGRGATGRCVRHLGLRREGDPLPVREAASA